MAQDSAHNANDVPYVTFAWFESLISDHLYNLLDISNGPCPEQVLGDVPGRFPVPPATIGRPNRGRSDRQCDTRGR